MTNPVQYFDKTIFITDKSVSYNGSFHNGLPEGKELLELFVSMLPDKAVVLDIGACTGSYALIDVIRPDVKIYSFEPSRAYHELVENIKVNGSKTKAFNLAVSDYTGTGPFNEVAANGSVALSIFNGYPQEKKKTVTLEVNCTTVDDFCRKIKPSAIKIDVEGGELYVLKGAIETLKKYKPIIFCEYSQENCNQYGYGRGEIVEFLTSLGYSTEILNNVDLIAV